MAERQSGGRREGEAVVAVVVPRVAPCEVDGARRDVDAVDGEGAGGGEKQARGEEERDAAGAGAEVEDGEALWRVLRAAAVWGGEGRGAREEVG